MKIWLSVFALLLSTNAAFAASEAEHPKKVDWSFDGVFGTVDRQAAQRGFQVYKEVCASCHALKRNSYRDLAALGFSEAEVKAIAAEATIKDGPNDAGEMFDRPGRISDKFAAPFANDNAARASNNGALPPDLSLIIKSRHEGPDYVYSLLTGYETPPADVKMGEGMNYNPYFPGHQIAMPAPLSDGRITYQDGTVASLDQMAKDVVNFLQWAAEPEMEQRKHMGIKVFAYLFVFTGLFYLAKKRIWKNVK
jgi:ubiquinol-cytochrome c reductase cytochrome c1 subunit